MCLGQCKKPYSLETISPLMVVESWITIVCAQIALLPHHSLFTIPKYSLPSCTSSDINMFYKLAQHRTKKIGVLLALFMAWTLQDQKAMATLMGETRPASNQTQIIRT